MNKVILMGRLAQDPEVRYTPNGKAVATFALAVRKAKPNANGEYDANFIRIVVWDKTAEAIGNNLKKGDRILLDGSINVRGYTAQDGTKRNITEVVARSVTFLEQKEGKQSASGHADYSTFGSNADPDEEIPF